MTRRPFAGRPIKRWWRSVKAKTSGPRTRPARPSKRKPSRNGGRGWPSRAVVDMRYARWFALLLLSTLLAGMAIWHAHRSPDQPGVSAATARPNDDQRFLLGVVHDEQGPLAEATVRFQGTREAVMTDAAGRFRLPLLPQNSSRVTAWKKGSLIGGAAADASPLIISLMP